jgi:hypothetical protein
MASVFVEIIGRQLSWLWWKGLNKCIIFERLILKDEVFFGNI